VLACFGFHFYHQKSLRGKRVHTYVEGQGIESAKVERREEQEEKKRKREVLFAFLVVKRYLSSSIYRAQKKKN